MTTLYQYQPLTICADGDAVGLKGADEIETRELAPITGFYNL
jgi:hypothetical protein